MLLLGECVAGGEVRSRPVRVEDCGERLARERYGRVAQLHYLPSGPVHLRCADCVDLRVFSLKLGVYGCAVYG